MRKLLLVGIGIVLIIISFFSRHIYFVIKAICFLVGIWCLIMGKKGSRQSAVEPRFRVKEVGVAMMIIGLLFLLPSLGLLFSSFSNQVPWDILVARILFFIFSGALLLSGNYILKFKEFSRRVAIVCSAVLLISCIIFISLISSNMFNNYSLRRQIDGWGMAVFINIFCYFVKGTIFDGK